MGRTRNFLTTFEPEGFVGKKWQLPKLEHFDGTEKVELIFSTYPGDNRQTDIVCTVEKL